MVDEVDRLDYSLAGKFRPCTKGKAAWYRRCGGIMVRCLVTIDGREQQQFVCDTCGRHDNCYTRSDEA